jgi:hypothetical protein
MLLICQVCADDMLINSYRVVRSKSLLRCLSTVRHKHFWARPWRIVATRSCRHGWPCSRTEASGAGRATLPRPNRANLNYLRLVYEVCEVDLRNSAHKPGMFTRVNLAPNLVKCKFVMEGISCLPFSLSSARCYNYHTSMES